MKKLLTKIRSKYLLISFGLNLMVCLVFLAINSFHFTSETYDDFFTSLFIAKGYDKCLFVSYFSTVILVLLQKVFTTVNVWTLSLFLFNFVSVVLIIYIFLCKFGTKLGILFSLLFNIAFGYYNFVSLQFTRTSVTMATAGYLLIVCFLFNTKDKRIWVNWQSIIGTVLVIFSSFYRFQAFLSVSGVFLVFMFSSLCVQQLKSWKENTKINYFSFVKKLVFLILILLISFSLEKLSAYIKTSDTDYLYHENYQKVRSLCVDYNICPYSENEKFYNSIGISSENDLQLLCSWIVGDEDFFTLERLTAIAEHSKENRDFMNHLNMGIKMVSNVIAKKLGSAYNIIIILLTVCCIIFLILLVIFRNKWKWMFPFLFAIIWTGFLYLFYAFYHYDLMYMAVFPGILMIFLSFLSNRYHFIVQCFMSAVLFVLTIYLEFTRSNFRGTYTFIFPVMCIAIYNFDKNNIQINVRNFQPNVKKGILSVGVVVYLAVSITIFRMFPFFEISESNYSIFTYIENHKENFYLFDLLQVSAMKNSDDLILKPDMGDNSIYSGWAIGSAWFNRTKKAYHVEHLYSDMIDNPHAFYISDKRISQVEKYYNDHYSGGKNNIILEPVKNDGFMIYRICTKD